MDRFLNIAQIRHIEAEAFAKHKLNLMDEAGAAIAYLVKSIITKPQKILILVGRGNNGGDGVVAALKLHALGYGVAIFPVSAKLNPSTENLIAQFTADKGKVLTRLPTKFDNYDLIIDAILGIGINGMLEERLIQLIDIINQSGKPILAIDTPTGLDPFSAQVYGNAVRAHYTITFISDKPGFYTGHGIDLVGRVTLETLVNLEDYSLTGAQTVTKIVANELERINYLPLIRKIHNTNKGMFGTVAIIGGNCGMHGALYLAARAAMLLGSGKVIMAPIDDKFLPDFLTPELMLTSPKKVLKNLKEYSVIVIGPGFGVNEKALKILSQLISAKIHACIIVDADALNLIAANPQLHADFKLIADKIITPHPGEAARLLGVSVNEVEQNRFAALNKLKMKFNATVLLKGAGSLIEDSNCIYLNQTGNTALSNAGQGDTLCGVAAAFIAQGMDLSSAIRLGVYLQGSAAEALSGSIGYNGVLATEIALTARNLLNQLLYKL
ncbi:MAG: NAD(P)H-hydrate dehydratase [Burkholderiales bacterium]|nr:NAD(P)H-hydrate dehydratase [Burkholderiales bacterium]